MPRYAAEDHLTQPSPGNFALANLHCLSANIRKRMLERRAFKAQPIPKGGECCSGLPSPLGEKDRMRGTQPSRFRASILAPFRLRELANHGCHLRKLNIRAAKVMSAAYRIRGLPNPARSLPRKDGLLVIADTGNPPKHKFHELIKHRRGRRMNVALEQLQPYHRAVTLGNANEAYGVRRRERF